MATVSDAKFAALRTQLFTGAMPDMTLQWLQANGGASPSVPDAWREFLTTVVANGGFNDASAWVLGDGWTISAGEAHCDGTQLAVSLLQQSLVLTTATDYTISFEVTAYTSGAIAANIGGDIQAPVSSVGVFVFTGTAISTLLALDASEDFVGSIDNVVVTDVLVTSKYQRNDSWFALLRSLGHTGSLNDMELAFWVGGGVLP